MSMRLWINLGGLQGRQPDKTDLVTLYEEIEALDDLAEALDQVPLSAYFDDTDLQYQLNDGDHFDDDEETWDNDEAEWFYPKECLLTVNALLAHLQANGEALAEDTEQAIRELSHVQQVLSQAESEGMVCHLMLVM
ncbi:hypothetical protein C4K68_14755 [Pokkaliibacter plantistimulans]|uniref:Uncharacterized protein n=1 Tax=Proteobacteria bacterium 228 TaxID=2083153 RepID=A0A2S5KNX5_9PROT|nr:hypothetical protein [Pokkaliibacter plantistimulans]PPC76544.1 hypothetical protein C4K68_14755 [Pokkaliibacter plantistimulans]